MESPSPELVEVLRRHVGTGLDVHDAATVNAVLTEIAERGIVEVYQDSLSAAYVGGVEPVGPEVFLTDPYYLGEFGKTIYPVWKRELIEVLDPAAKIEEWGLGGAQGGGKSVASLAAQTYKLYRASRLISPLRYYSFDKVSKLYWGFFQLNQAKAKAELYDKFLAILEQSPYFKENFPMRKSRRRLYVAPAVEDGVAEDLSTFEILFPSSIRVVAGSLTTHAVSLNLMSAILDEMNWKVKKTVSSTDDPNSAENLYGQVAKRVRGRFVGTHHVTAAGLLCVISSARRTSDFMETMMQRMKSEPERCRVSNFSLWEVKGDRKYSKQTFTVFVGSSFGASKILTEPDIASGKYDLTGPGILKVPMDFYSDFSSDLTGSIMDIGGVATTPKAFLFDSEQQIRDCFDLTRTSPWELEEVPLGTLTDITLDRFFDEDKCTFFDGMTRMPKDYPGVGRFLHVDLSKSDAATGITMLCPYATRRIVTKTPEGKSVAGLIPLVFVDFTIRITPRPGEEIDYDKIRQFILYLRRLGFPISCVSFDSYASADSMQLLAKSNIKTAYISTVRTDEPFLALRSAFLQKRVNLYPYEPVVSELSQLVRDGDQIIKPDRDKAGGPSRKDVADSLAGAYWSLVKALAAIDSSKATPTTVSLGGLNHEAQTHAEDPILKSIFDFLANPNAPPPSGNPDLFPLQDVLRQKRIQDVKLGPRGGTKATP